MTTGTVYTETVVHAAPEQFTADAPYQLAIISLAEGGRVTAPVHPICHRTIHATLPNAQLARDYAEPAVLRAHPDIARFLAWIADKPADFHVPVRRRR